MITVSREAGKRVMDEFHESEIVVNCTTEEAAVDFLELLHNEGYQWINGIQTISTTNWDEYKENTMYLCFKDKDIMFGRKGEPRGRRVLSYAEFITRYNKDLLFGHYEGDHISLLDKFRNNKCEIQCQTKEEAIEFFKHLDALGYTWRTGDRLRPDDTNWDIYGSKTVYQCNMRNSNNMIIGGISFGEVEHHINNQLPIYPYKLLRKEFNPKNVIKSTDKNMTYCLNEVCPYGYTCLRRYPADGLGNINLTSFSCLSRTDSHTKYLEVSYE